MIWEVIPCLDLSLDLSPSLGLRLRLCAIHFSDPQLTPTPPNPILALSTSRHTLRPHPSPHDDMEGGRERRRCDRLGRVPAHVRRAASPKCTAKRELSETRPVTSLSLLCEIHHTARLHLATLHPCCMHQRRPPSPIAFAYRLRLTSPHWMSPRPPLIASQRFQRARDDKKSGWEPRRLYTMAEFMMVDKAQFTRIVAAAV